MTRRRGAAFISVVALSLAATACAVMFVGETADVASRVVALGPGVVAGVPVGAMRLESVVALSGGGIGGLSGLSVSPDGARFTAVADVGRVVSGRLIHGADGRLTGVADVRSAPLFAGGDGRADKWENDSEEIVRAADGGWLVSFERHHRIMRFDEEFAAGASPAALPTPPGLESAPENGGVEALAAFSDGALLAIEEGADDGRIERPAWITRGPPAVSADWGRFTYRRAPGFRPTGAAVLPNGDALILERRASLLAGVSARIVLLRRRSMTPGAVVEGLELASLATPLPVDNFEGVAAVSTRPGVVDVYLVSDDNFSPLQNTLLMHLTLPNGVLAAP